MKEKDLHYIWSVKNNKPEKIYVKVNGMTNHKMIIDGDFPSGIEIIMDCAAKYYFKDLFPIKGVGRYPLNPCASF